MDVADFCFVDIVDRKPIHIPWLGKENLVSFYAVVPAIYRTVAMPAIIYEKRIGAFQVQPGGFTALKIQNHIAPCLAPAGGAAFQPPH